MNTFTIDGGMNYLTIGTLYRVTGWLPGSPTALRFVRFLSVGDKTVRLQGCQPNGDNVTEGSYLVSRVAGWTFTAVGDGLMETVSITASNLQVGDVIPELDGERFTVEAVTRSRDLTYAYGIICTTEAGRAARIAPIGEFSRVRRVFDSGEAVTILPRSTSGKLADVLPFMKGGH